MVTVKSKDSNSQELQGSQPTITNSQLSAIRDMQRSKCTSCTHSHRKNNNNDPLLRTRRAQTSDNSIAHSSGHPRLDHHAEDQVPFIPQIPCSLDRPPQSQLTRCNHRSMWLRWLISHAIKMEYISMCPIYLLVQLKMVL